MTDSDIAGCLETALVDNNVLAGCVAIYLLYFLALYHSPGVPTYKHRLSGSLRNTIGGHSLVRGVAIFLLYLRALYYSRRVPTYIWTLRRLEFRWRSDNNVAFCRSCDGYVTRRWGPGGIKYRAKYSVWSLMKTRVILLVAMRSSCEETQFPVPLSTRYWVAALANAGEEFLLPITG
jgi:hypothetical protein